MFIMFLIGLGIGLFFGFGLGRKSALIQLGRAEYRRRVASVRYIRSNHDID